MKFINYSVLYGAGYYHTYSRPPANRDSYNDNMRELLKEALKYSSVTLSAGTLSLLAGKIAVIDPTLSYAVLKTTINAIVNKKDPLKAALEAGVEASIAKKIIDLIKDNL